MKTRLAVLILALFSVACGMNKQALEDGRKVPDSIAEAKKFIAEHESNYAKLFVAEGAWLKPYADRERWTEKFKAANAEASRAEKTFSDSLKPLLERNRGADEEAVKQFTKAITESANTARALARRPAIRAGALADGRKRAGEIHRDALSDYTAGTIKVEQVTSGIATSTESFPTRKDAIDKRASTALGLLAAANTAKTAVELQFANHDAGRETDYAVFVDKAAVLKTLREKLPAESTSLLSQLASLEVSHTRTLIDMKQRFWVHVTQVSWEENDWSDYWTEHAYNRAWVEVSEKLFDQLDDLPDDTVIATRYRSGRLEPATNIGWEILGALNLNPSNATEGFVDRDNEAEYEIGETRVDNYHRYSDESGGVVKETDWVAVTPEIYEDFYNDLGMTVQAKAFGTFDDEVESDAAPPGMAYVGNARYGTWRTNPDGSSFWEFYGKYAFFRSMLPSSHSGYSRAEWDEYRTQRDKDEPYYGGTNVAPRYGSASANVQSHPRYAATDFGRSGGFHTALSEVRTAGVQTRGGGPGGGGK